MCISILHRHQYSYSHIWIISTLYIFQPTYTKALLHFVINTTATTIVTVLFLVKNIDPLQFHANHQRLYVSYIFGSKEPPHHPLSKAIRKLSKISNTDEYTPPPYLGPTAEENIV